MDLFGTPQRRDKSQRSDRMHLQCKPDWVFLFNPASEPLDSLPYDDPVGVLLRNLEHGAWSPLGRFRSLGRESMNNLLRTHN